MSGEQSAGAALWRGRRETDLLRVQIRAIDAWTAARRALDLHESAAARASRETRLDAARRMDVIRRQHQALIQRTQAQMRESAHLLRRRVAPRVEVAHRSEWFRDRLCAALAGAGVDVVAQLENGADAVGFAVAEQPDLILVEDHLPMMTGPEVIREVLRFSPHTIAVAQVRNDGEIGTLLAAGARTAFSRRLPPAEVAQELCALLSV